MTTFSIGDRVRHRSVASASAGTIVGIATWDPLRTHYNIQWDKWHYCCDPEEDLELLEKAEVSYSPTQVGDRDDDV